MVAEVTISQIYWNRGLSNFFFREQALSTLEDLINRSSVGAKEVLSILDELTEDMNINDVEEEFYSYSVEDIAESYNIELDDDEDEE